MTATSRSLPACAVALALAVATAIPGLVSNAAENGSASGAPDAAGMLERGRYLVTIAACNDCHTPWIVGPNGPEPDSSRTLSGHPAALEMPGAPALPDGPWIVSVGATNTAWAGPWGVSFTANLTPDRETGLGKWDLRTFIDTIRTGRHLGRGREILPPMPIAMYKHFTDEDMAAVFAYLQSIPAVSNRVPAPLPPDRAANPSEDPSENP